jgi:epoxyqueuosine reductase
LHLTDAVKRQARDLGFDMVRITPVARPPHAPAYLDWLACGLHGEMGYLAERAALRLDPAALAPGARSIIMLVANYNPGPPLRSDDPARGRIARYAWSGDYHDIIKSRLYTLDGYIRDQTGRTVPGKACVDTAPFLERDFAQSAGLGFAGKNTVLITPGVGSWTFLAALLVPEILDYDAHPEAKGARPEIGSIEVEHPPIASAPRWRLAGPDGAPHIGTCGACTRCLSACPTGAFVGPYVLDARRCISYLTIELRGPIPREIRPALGNWIFGCDVCQDVCPYNRNALKFAWPALAPDPDRGALLLLDLLALDDAGFRARFRGTAVLRTRRRGLVRNACVAAGNWCDPAAIPALSALLHDVEPLVRGHAGWALGRIGSATARHSLETAQAAEHDPYVLDEFEFALANSNRSV